MTCMKTLRIVRSSQCQWRVQAYYPDCVERSSVLHWPLEPQKSECTGTDGRRGFKNGTFSAAQESVSFYSVQKRLRQATTLVGWISLFLYTFNPLGNKHQQWNTISGRCVQEWCTRRFAVSVSIGWIVVEHGNDKEMWRLNIAYPNEKR